MNKQELHEAFSNIHASEDLVKEVLTMKNKEESLFLLGGFFGRQPLWRRCWL